MNLQKDWDAKWQMDSFQQFIAFQSTEGYWLVEAFPVLCSYIEGDIEDIAVLSELE